MRMRYYLAFSVLALTACGAVQENVYRVQEETRKEAYTVVGKIQDYLAPPNYHKPNPQEPPPSYCYHTAVDILCYNQPLPGQEERLVGYQGIHPSVLVAPSPAAQRHEPPRAPTKVIHHTEVKETAPSGKVVRKQEKTVFVDMAPQVKPDDAAVQTIPAADGTAKLPVADAPRDLMATP